MSRNDATFIGEVDSVSGGIVSVRLRAEMPSTLVLVEGESYRIGQVGAFVRIPLGYAHLYAVCTQVGAAAAPENVVIDGESGRRWMSVTLFGEALGKRFERGVSQYPTVSDEVHLVTTKDLEIIYGSLATPATITVGALAASSGIPGQLDLGNLLARHCAIVGSTGAGKSNLIAVLLEAIATQGYPRARVLVIDPHGEYAPAFSTRAYVFRLVPEEANQKRLEVPFWALPFDELRDIVLGGLPSGVEAQIRDEIISRKRQAASHLAQPPPEQAINADSPIPFDIRDNLVSSSTLMVNTHPRFPQGRMFSDWCRKKRIRSASKYRFGPCRSTNSGTSCWVDCPPA